MNDLIESTRPTDDGLAAEWTPQRRRQVLDDVLTGRARRLEVRRRPWPVAVAAALVVVPLLAVPVAFPGWVSPPAAAEIGEVAAAASERPCLEWGAGQYLRVESVDTQRGLWTDAGLDPTVSLHTTFDEYHSPDGWTWSDRVVDGAVEQYLFPPSYGWSRPDYAAGLPTEPHLLDAFLRLRAFGSSSVDEAVFQAVATMLRAESAPPQVRSAAVGVLGLNPKVSVADATDPGAARR